MKHRVLLFVLFLTFLPFGSATNVDAQAEDYADTRQILHVADPAIVRIGNDTNYGTGTFIAPNKILTAAHVVNYFPNNNFDIYPAQHGNFEPDAVRPTRVDVHPYYNHSDPNSPQYDLAVITVPMTSFFYYPYRSVAPGSVPVYVDTYRWFGYPIDLNYNGFMVPPSYNQYGDEGNPADFLYSGNVVQFNRPSAQGQSGSALISDFSSGVTGTLHGGSTPEETLFTLLTPDNYNFVNTSVLR